ncbi:MAG: DegT/DnrJ/EryC1/StrS family aminotransferase, partial [Calditrichia bacterium]
VAAWYEAELNDVEEISLQKVPPNARKSWFVFVVKLTQKFNQSRRDQILDSLRKKGIACSDYFSPIHLQPFMRKSFGFKENDFPVTESVSARTIALPFYGSLTHEQVRYTTNTLKKLLLSA